MIATVDVMEKNMPKQVFFIGLWSKFFILDEMLGHFSGKLLFDTFVVEYLALEIMI